MILPGERPVWSDLPLLNGHSVSISDQRWVFRVRLICRQWSNRSIRLPLINGNVGRYVSRSIDTNVTKIIGAQNRAPREVGKIVTFRTSVRTAANNDGAAIGSLEEYVCVSSISRNGTGPYNDRSLVVRNCLLSNILGRSRCLKGADLRSILRVQCHNPCNGRQWRYAPLCWRWRRRGLEYAVGSGLRVRCRRSCGLTVESQQS